MINLLSDGKKAEIHAGRFNTIMLRYIFMTLVAAGLLVGVLASAYLALSTGRANAQSRVESSERSSAQYTSVRKEADEFRKNLAVSKQIFSKEVAYSRLIVKFTNALPPGAVLDNVRFDEKSIGVPITLNFHAKNPAIAAGLKKHLEEQKDIFSSVKYSQIIYDSGQGAQGEYPVSVNINLTIRKEVLK